MYSIAIEGLYVYCGIHQVCNSSHMQRMRVRKLFEGFVSDNFNKICVNAFKLQLNLASYLVMELYPKYCNPTIMEHI